MSEEIQQQNLLDDLDIDFLLQRFSDDPIFDPDLLRDSWIPESDPPSNLLQSAESSSPVLPSTVDSLPLDHGSPDSVSSFVNYIENFLMEDVDWEDEGKEEEIMHVFAGALFDGSDCSKVDLGQSKMKEVNEVVDVVQEDEDFEIKKRRRQMRNRESAMNSRERKKMYIKDLETKNKHLETEFRRLDYSLRCCLAENIALRQSFQVQKNRSCGASVAKQESAVLLMESLLLGSLFWFTSLVCLFLLPSPRSLSPNLEVLSWSGRDLAAAKKSRNSLMFGKDLKLILLCLRRRCRSLRTRMKFLLFPLHVVFT